LYAPVYDALGLAAPSFKEIIIAFLEGHGAPCPELLEAAKVHISPLVNLDQVDDVAFRSRMFAWASTGSQAIEVGTAPNAITVRGAYTT
jgi:hypothetical protein